MPVLLGGSALAAGGSLVGAYRSLRKSEKQNHPDMKQTNVGQYLGRATGVLAGGTAIPIVGGVTGDYLVSRHMQNREKKAYFALAPFKTKSGTPYDSAAGYGAEYGNQLVGTLAGGVPGLAVAGAGALLAGKLPNVGVGLAGLGAAGAIAGSLVGGYRSLRKSEKQNHPDIKQTTPGKLLGRVGGSVLGGAVIPMVGGIAGDYAVSRHMQDR